MPRISEGTSWSRVVTEAVPGFCRRWWRCGVEFGASVRTLRRRARMPFRVSIQVAALATFVLVTTVLFPGGHIVVAPSSAADAQPAAFTAASPSQDPLGLTWWDRSSGAVSTWLLNGSGTVLGYQLLSKTCGTAGGCSDNWIPLGLADVDGDGHSDLMWWDRSSGAVSTWLLNGSGTVLGYQLLSKTCGTAGGCSDNWIPLGLADVNGDGHPDLMWWDPSSGAVSTWLLNGSGTVLGYQLLSKTCGTAGGCSDNWIPLGLADVDGDGHPDLMWWDPSSGAVSTWLLNGSGTVLGYQLLSKTCGTAGGCSDNWAPLGLADVNGDGHPDLMWWDPSSGAVSTWLLNGSGTVLGYQLLSKTCGTAGGCSSNWLPVSTFFNSVLAPAVVG